MEQKDKAFYLRISQMVLTFVILLLEFIQAIGFASSYRSPPTHSTVVYYWMVIVVTVLFLGHLLIRFQPRWRYGPYKDEILLDGLLFFIWLTMNFLNILPVLRGNSLSCDMTDSSALTRCNLFMANFVFTILLTITLPFSLYISFSRWINRQPSSSIQMSSISQQQQVSQPQRSPSYKMQKGVLKDGQPVLLFHSNGDKRNSKRLSLYNHKRSSSVPNLLKDSESAKSAKSIESYLSHELV